MAYIGKTPTSAPLTSSDVTDGIITSAKIVDGTISSADLASDAVDLQPLKSDITALALREATNEASAAFNLPNQFIETFTDDTNLGTQTDGDRDSGYWTTSASVAQDSSSYAVAGGNISTTGSHANAYDGDSNTGFAFTTNSSVSGYATFDFGASYTWNQMDIGKDRGHGDGRSILITYSADDSSYSNVDFTNASSTVVSYNGTSANLSNFASDGTADWAALSTNGHDSLCRVTGFSTFAARYLRYKFGSADFHDANAVFSEFKWYKVSVNATGTLIQSANTVGSAKTKVGGTMLYKDNAGTATLGTDLIIYFTCDGGSNWTEADSYNAITPVYSTGVKQVRLGETTCTSGTDIRYKAVWANQSSGSKETQLHGIGVNY
jgi:hypothetical protein